MPVANLFPPHVYGNASIPIQNLYRGLFNDLGLLPPGTSLGYSLLRASSLLAVKRQQVSISSDCVQRLSRHLSPLPTEPTRSTPISQHHLSLFCEVVAAGQLLIVNTATAAATWHHLFRWRSIPHPGHLPGLRLHQRSCNIGTSGHQPCKHSRKHDACDCSRSRDGPGSRCFLLTNNRSCSQPSSSRHFFLLAPAIVAADRIHRNRVTITLQQRSSAAHLLSARCCLSARCSFPSVLLHLLQLSALLPQHIDTIAVLPLLHIAIATLRPAASHIYSKPASLIIVGCFLFFSTCTSSAFLSVK
ncbi:hypothetical protein GW17_00037402 [Ensete ventricosum]|nr:hypothetical protein GW17_00037402 [Ensete ventricosum]